MSQQHSCSLDHLVGDQQEIARYSQAESFSCLEVDNELELARRLNRKITSLLTFEDSIGINRRALKIVDLGNSVGQQAAIFSPVMEWVDGRQSVASRQRDDLSAMGIGEAVRHHDKAAVRLACLCGNDGFDFAAVIDRRHGLLHCERPGRSFEGRQIIIGIGRRRGIEQDSDPSNTRRNLLEQLQPLAGYPWLHNVKTGGITSRMREAGDEAAAERIGYENKNDGNAARFLQQSRSGWRAVRKYEVRVQRALR